MIGHKNLKLAMKMKTFDMEKRNEVRELINSFKPTKVDEFEEVRFAINFFKNNAGEIKKFLKWLKKILNVNVTDNELSLFLPHLYEAFEFTFDFRDYKNQIIQTWKTYQQGGGNLFEGAKNFNPTDIILNTIKNESFNKVQKLIKQPIEIKEVKIKKDKKSIEEEDKKSIKKGELSLFHDFQKEYLDMEADPRDIGGFKSLGFLIDQVKKDDDDDYGGSNIFL